MSSWTTATPSNSFLLTPLREGRLHTPCGCTSLRHISTHAPAGGATVCSRWQADMRCHFYSRPCGRGDYRKPGRLPSHRYFYSRPCGRGDNHWLKRFLDSDAISTHAPAGGATPIHRLLSPYRISISTHAPAGGATRLPSRRYRLSSFLLTPLREGRQNHLYDSEEVPLFLLTPLREGRLGLENRVGSPEKLFLLTPLREGRLLMHGLPSCSMPHFYSRPCGRGDTYLLSENTKFFLFLLTPLREGRPRAT